ncbi:kinase-like protein [Gymnopus androsaceus JB14]|uniref:Kinase-like protein n=1 Tax=Gymnopus androsaceus JB14 TaxID=1447944 RepID=A0A6A4H0S2_9AGAR|nr:kinase-like protein [Gymnopus androsaceus JB14]
MACRNVTPQSSKHVVHKIVVSVFQEAKCSHKCEEVQTRPTFHSHMLTLPKRPEIDCMPVSRLLLNRVGLIQTHSCIMKAMIHSQEYEYVVFWQAILLGESAKFSKTFGNGAEKPKGSTFMNELKALILGKFNAEFTGSGQNNQQRIKAEENKFRWHTGCILIAGTEAATVDNFYMMHSKTSADLELYIHNLPAHLSKGNGSKNAKTRKFYLEFAINFQAYKIRTELDDDFLFASKNKTSKLSVTRKRTCSTSGISLSSIQGGKHSKGGSRSASLALQSQYMPMPNAYGTQIKIYSPTHVKFKHFDCEVDTRSLQFKFLNLQADSPNIKAQLDDKPFAEGGMKLAVDLRVGNQQLVAKRYNKFTLSVNSGALTDADKIKQNRSMIYPDAARLAQGAVFMKSFYARAKMLGATDMDLRRNYMAGQRESSFTKFTGTVVHVPSSNRGETSNTVHAFAHYVHWYTNGQLVMADLQGNIKAQTSNITELTRNSGCGDHGEAGMKGFVNDHKCNEVCELMELSGLQDNGEDS